MCDTSLAVFTTIAKIVENTLKLVFYVKLIILNGIGKIWKKTESFIFAFILKSSHHFVPAHNY